jgi:hypothetical protein
VLESSCSDACGCPIPVTRSLPVLQLRHDPLMRVPAPRVQGQWRSIEDFWRDCGCPGDIDSCATAEDPPAIEPVVLLPSEAAAACSVGPGDDIPSAASHGSADRLPGAGEPKSVSWHPVLYAISCAKRPAVYRSDVCSTLHVQGLRARTAQQ